MTRARPHTCVFLVAAVAALVFVAPPVAHAEPGNLSSTWEAEISAAESNLAGEKQKLEEAQEELAEAEADGSVLAESRRERVEDYEACVAAAEAQLTAARAGLVKQTELDKAGEPQDRLREVKESISYYETLRDESQKAGATGTAELAIEELQGEIFGGGLYELQEKAKVERSAKEAAKNAVGGETTANEETNETTEAAAPGDDGGAGNEAAPEPEPTPEELEGAGDGPGFLSGMFGSVNLVPILAFIGLVAAAIFALSKAGGTSIIEYFSLKQFVGPVMGRHKKTKLKKPKPKKTPVATKPQEPAPESPEIEAPEDEPERREKKPRPEPGAETGGVTVEELDELFGITSEEDDGLPDDQEPPE